MDKISKYFSRPPSSCEATKRNSTGGTPEKPQRRHSLESGLLSRPLTASKSIVSSRKVLPLVDQPTVEIEEQFLERKRRLSEIADGIIVSDLAANPKPVRPKSSMMRRRNSTSTIITQPTSTPTPTTTSSTFQNLSKFSFLDFSNHNNNKNNNKASTVIVKVRGDWREEIHGGVKMWVHIKTNEVSVSNPFKEEEEKRLFSHEDSEASLRVKQGPIPKGTATTLYDQSAVSEMFKLLDEQT